MLPVSKQIAVAMLCVVTIFLLQAPAQAAGLVTDIVGKEWKARAETATKKLAIPGLDKCDKALELAFQHPNEVTSGAQRSFELMIEIDSLAMVASYSYEGQRLASFVLLAVPPGWYAVQKATSKNMNILVTGANCTFDLCTNAPFTSGPCVEQPLR